MFAVPACIVAGALNCEIYKGRHFTWLSSLVKCGDWNEMYRVFWFISMLHNTRRLFLRLSTLLSKLSLGRLCNSSKGFRAVSVHSLCVCLSLVLFRKT